MNRITLIPDVDLAIEIHVMRSHATWQQIESKYGKRAYNVWRQADFVGRGAGNRDAAYPDKLTAAPAYSGGDPIDQAIEINILRGYMTWKSIEVRYGGDAYKTWKKAGFAGRRAGRRDATFPVA